MNVLITGGTGFIGKECALALKAAGHAVTILARSQTAGKPLESAGYRFAIGDLAIPESLRAALVGIDAIVHCVGIILEPTGVTFESVVVDGTRHLLDACNSAHITKFVYISALGTRPNAVSRYHKTKWQAEEMISASGIPYTIFRPSVVYGKGDKFINTFMKMPVLVLPGGGKGLFQPTYVKDLAQMVVSSMQNPNATNATLDAGGPDTLTYEKMMKTSLRIKGVKRIAVPSPMWLMRVLSIIHDPFQRIYLPLALITKDQYLMMQEDNIGDSSHLAKAMPEIHQRPFEVGLREYLP